MTVTGLIKINDLAPGLGFEPRLSDSESDVLPLDDPGMCPDCTRFTVILPGLIVDETAKKTHTTVLEGRNRTLHEQGTFVYKPKGKQSSGTTTTY